MKNKDSIKNLNQMALKTSIVLGILFAMPPFKHIPFSIPIFLITVFIACSLSLSIWAINISLVYISEKYNHKKFGNKLRHLISYALNGLLITILYICIKLFIDFFPEDLKQVLSNAPNENIRHLIAFVFLLNTIIIIIEESILLRNKKIMVELENAQLKIKNAEAFYQQLKQQIHPHFLFNSLNILKTLIKENPDVAEEYLLRLSDFLRVSISSNNENTVKLEDELKLCIDYLEMQKLRFGNALEYSINIPTDVKLSGYLPVFSLQILLENAIKHNSLTAESPLLIKIDSQNEYITVQNNIQNKITSEISTGLGLSNLSERYKILTDEDILITKSEKEFCVRIKILTQ